MAAAMIKAQEAKEAIEAQGNHGLRRSMVAVTKKAQEAKEAIEAQEA